MIAYLKYLKYAKGNFVGQWSPLFLKNQRRFLEWLAPLRFVSPTWYDVIIIELTILTWWINSFMFSLCADSHRSHQLMAVHSRTLRKFGPLGSPLPYAIGRYVVSINIPRSRERKRGKKHGQNSQARYSTGGSKGSCMMFTTYVIIRTCLSQITAAMPRYASTSLRYVKRAHPAAFGQSHAVNFRHCASWRNPWPGE